MSTMNLAPAFTLADAEAFGLRKGKVYEMLAAGEIERAGRGVYLRPNAIYLAFAPLAAATVVRNEATMCLTSALAHHDLSDTIPFGTEIALPRGKRYPAGFAHVTWHSFDRATFAVGRENLEIAEDTTIAVYSAERTIVDSASGSCTRRATTSRTRRCAAGSVVAETHRRACCRSRTRSPRPSRGCGTHSRCCYDPSADSGYRGGAGIQRPAQPRPSGRARPSGILYSLRARRLSRPTRRL